jgi:hypothetical protein
MKLRFLFGLWSAWLAFLAHAPAARAQGERPILVEYNAPTPECASSEAFQALLRAEMARSSDVESPRRFALRIRRVPDGRYEGTLSSEMAVRQVTASRCDEVTGSLATIIAMAETSTDVPAPPAGPAPAPAAPLPASATVPAPAAVAPRSEPSDPDDRKLDSSDHASRSKWRVGLRGFATNHPSWGTPNPGVMGSASIEVPWGFHAMMFEWGIGALFANGNTPQELAPTIGPTSVPSTLTFVIADTNACLLDVPIAESGVSLLGCLRVAGAFFSGAGGAIYPKEGLAVWGGLSTRLRWQSPIRLFLEVNFDPMYGTISDAADGRPWWFEGGASLGFQI